MVSKRRGAWRQDMEDPGMLSHLGHGVLKNILKRPECLDNFLQWALLHGTEQEKFALTANPTLPLHLRAKLPQLKGLFVAWKPDPDALTLMAFRPKFPTPVDDKAKNDPIR